MRTNEYCVIQKDNFPKVNHLNINSTEFSDTLPEKYMHKDAGKNKVQLSL